MFGRKIRLGAAPVSEADAKRLLAPAPTAGPSPDFQLGLRDRVLWEFQVSGAGARGETSLVGAPMEVATEDGPASVADLTDVDAASAAAAVAHARQVLAARVAREA